MPSRSPKIFPMRNGIIAGVVVCALGWVGGAQAFGQALEGSVRTALSGAKLEKARVGVAIIDCATGQALATIDEHELYAPASNMKLVTSGVALSILKESFEFRTGFAAKDGVLVIKGAGDPALCDPELLKEQGWSVERFLGRIVDAAVAGKVSGVREVVIDDRVFDRAADGGSLVHPTWPREQLNRWYCAPVSGLNFFTNVIELRATRGDRAGNKPNVTTEPAAPWYVNLDLSATRTVNDGSSSLWAQQDQGGGGKAGGVGSGVIGAYTGVTFKVFGDVKTDIVKPVEVTVAQPGVFFARLLARELWKAGVTGGKEPGVRLAAEGEDLSAISAAPFAVVSTPLAAALKRCNVDSQNLYAECLLKRTAFEVTQQPGSWATGSQVAAMRVAEKVGGAGGLGTGGQGGLRVVDGSGMSRENQITPMLMARWLAALHQDTAVRGPFLESLARADDRGASISKRFADRRLGSTVYAKTGYIDKVRCLSGYVVRGEKAIAYSVLVNNLTAGDARAKDFQEDVVMIIDRWLARQAPDAPTAATTR